MLQYKYLKNNLIKRGTFVKIKAGQEAVYKEYEEESKTNESVRKAFKLANEFTDYAEDLLEKNETTLCDIYEKAMLKLCESFKEKLNGAEKNLAYHIIIKSWQYSEEFMDYNTKQEDGYCKKEFETMENRA